MRLSQKRTTALYAAVADPIMDLRIKAAREQKSWTPDQADDRLYALTNAIWMRVAKELGVEP